MVNIGDKYGHIKVIGEAGRNAGHRSWLVQCDCGKQTVMRGDYVTKARRCFGCAAKENGRLRKPDPEKQTKLYKLWAGRVRHNCCDEWNEYTAFKAWALEHGYSEGKKLCRKRARAKDDGIASNYSPESCEIKDWAKKLTVKNKKTGDVATYTSINAAARALGVRPLNIWSCIEDGINEYGNYIFQ